jgi:predicted acylesterase/phospholipase RssA
MNAPPALVSGEAPDPAAPSRGSSSHAVTLALQGGGSLGAFSWGVLDRLLDLPSLRIEVVSGASAGAMNAALLAQGTAAGARPKPADRLPSNPSIAARVETLGLSAQHTLYLCYFDLDNFKAKIVCSWVSQDLQKGVVGCGCPSPTPSI